MSKIFCLGIVIVGSLFYFIILLALVGTGAFYEVALLPLAPTLFGQQDISWEILIIKLTVLAGLTFSFYGYLANKITRKSSGFYWPLAVFSLLAIISVMIFADRTLLRDVNDRAIVSVERIFAKEYAHNVTKILPMTINNNLVLTSVVANINILTVEFMIMDSDENPPADTPIQVDSYSASLREIYCSKNENGENSYEHYGIIIKGRLVDQYGTLIHAQQFDYGTCPDF